MSNGRRTVGTPGVGLVLGALAAVIGGVFVGPQLSALEVQCVPWLGEVNWRETGQGAQFYHRTWSGKEVSLKGTVLFNGTASYEWNYGDGSGSTTGTVNAAAYWPRPAPIPGIWHAYVGDEGDRFFPTLRVTANEGGEVVEASDQYPIVLVRRQPRQTRWVDRADVHVAIEEALWWLYQRAIPYKGQWPETMVYWAREYNLYYVAQSAAAIQAFELNGHLPPPSTDLDPQTVDPYVDVVRRGLYHLFAASKVVPIPAGLSALDVNDNDYGLTCWNAPNGESHREPPEMYEVGLAMMAIAGSGTPKRRALIGREHDGVDGRLYEEILQDMVDFCSYAQNGPECTRYQGGWRYRRRYCAGPYPGEVRKSDNSVTQWPIIGMHPGEKRLEWNVTVPELVKDRLRGWLNKSQVPNSPGLSSRGGICYVDDGNPGYPRYWPNVAKTAGTGITGFVFVRDAIQDEAELQDNDNRIQRATDYIVRNWNNPPRDPQNSNLWMNFGNIYAMYGVSKAFDGEFRQRQDLKIGDDRDWYLEYASYLIGTMTTDPQGRKYRWGKLGSYGLSSDFSTALAVLILSGGVVERPPIAVARAKRAFKPDGTPSGEEGLSEIHVDVGDAVILDAGLSITGSYPIRDYEWDIDGDGSEYDVKDEEPTFQLTYQSYKTNPYTDPYRVRLRVTDTRSDIVNKPDQSDEDFCLVYVHPPPHRPVAVIAASPQIACPGDTITVSGSESYDPNDGEEIHEWIWTVDGEPVTCDSGDCSQIELSWNEPGSHSVKLIVRSVISGTDPLEIPEDPESAPSSITLTVSDDPTPVAHLWSPTFDGGDDCPQIVPDRPIVVPPGTEVTLRADCSYDIRCDGETQPLTYRWETNGDGAFGGPEEPTGPEVTLSSDEELTRTVCVEVVGGGSAGETACRTIRWTCARPTPVMVFPDLQHPENGETKRCEPEPEGCASDPTIHRICPGAVIVLDASPSHVCDNPDASLQYDWDLDSDGYYDDAQGVVATASWDDIGIKEIGLRVSRVGGGVSGVGVENQATLRTAPVVVVPCADFQRGDTNCDGKVDMSDAICLLTYLFLRTDNDPCICTTCWDAVDANDDGRIGEEVEELRRVCTYEEGVGLRCVFVEQPSGGGAADGGPQGSDISDAILILNVLFLGTPGLPAPYQVCGRGDRVIDVLGCDFYSACSR